MYYDFLYFICKVILFLFYLFSSKTLKYATYVDLI